MNNADRFMYLIKSTLILSVALSSFWISVFLFEAIFHNDYELVFGMLSGCMCAVVSYWYFFKKKAYFWRVSTPDWKACATFTILAYITTLPLGFLIGQLYVLIYFGEFKELKGEIYLLVGLSCIWFPLWWSPALGIIWGQFYTNKKFLKPSQPSRF